MDIMAMIKERAEQHGKCQEFIGTKENEILKVKEEMLKIEGEHRVLVELAKAQGLIDENGNVLAPVAPAPVVDQTQVVDVQSTPVDGGVQDGTSTEQTQES